MPYEDIHIQTRDGEELRAYLMMQPEEIRKSRPTVYMLHANAGNMGHRLPIAKIFYRHMHCNVFIISYRGYGKSTGKANQAGLRIDSRAGFEFLRNHSDLGNTSLLLYGQSLGGAVAIDLAAEHQGEVCRSVRVFTATNKLS